MLDLEQPLQHSREAAAGLGGKLAMMLWQTPRSLHKDMVRLQRFAHVRAAGNDRKVRSGCRKRDSMNVFDYVIVGGGLAGASVVQGIRERDTQGSILLVGEETHLP